MSNTHKRKFSIFHLKISKIFFIKQTIKNKTNKHFIYYTISVLLYLKIIYKIIHICLQFRGFFFKFDNLFFHKTTLIRKES